MKRSSEFKVGDRVKFNTYAKSRGLRLRESAEGMGTVVGLCPPLSIRVLPDGYAQPQKYAASFWTVVRGKE
jgi:hypothetical protein